MNIYDRIKTEMHTIADINSDGKIDKADIAVAIDYVKKHVGTGWQSYATATFFGVFIGAFLMWVF